MNVAFADISLPLWLVVSQWTLLFALGFLIIVMYRQVGLLEQLKDAGSEREGLTVGEKAPSFDHIPIKQDTNDPLRFEPTEGWTLLAFADPECVSCENTVRALERLSPKLRQTMRVLVVTRSQPPQIAASDAFSTASFAISRIRADVSYKVYRTNVTPFGYLIDPQGMIRAKGVIGDEASIRNLVQKGNHVPINVEFIVS